MVTPRPTAPVAPPGVRVIFNSPRNGVAAYRMRVVGSLTVSRNSDMKRVFSDAALASTVHFRPSEVMKTPAGPAANMTFSLSGSNAKSCS